MHITTLSWASRGAGGPETGVRPPWNRAAQRRTMLTDHAVVSTLAPVVHCGGSEPSARRQTTTPWLQPRRRRSSHLIVASQHDLAAVPSSVREETTRRRRRLGAAATAHEKLAHEPSLRAVDEPIGLTMADTEPVHRPDSDREDTGENYHSDANSSSSLVPSKSWLLTAHSRSAGPRTRCACGAGGVVRPGTEHRAVDRSALG